jgi:hypothetical protein
LRRSDAKLVVTDAQTAQQVDGGGVQTVGGLEGAGRAWFISLFSFVSALRKFLHFIS